MSNENVISLDRARRAREEAEFHLSFPHMYEDVQDASRRMLDELSWLDDNQFIPEGLMHAFVNLDTAVRDAMIQLAAYINDEMRAGEGDGD